VLVIPGLDGHTGLWEGLAPHLFPGLRPVWFDHARDRAAGGLDGLASRAIQALDADPDGHVPAYVCGESFGGTVALTLARRYPARVRGVILFSTFAWYPAVLAGRAGLAAWRLLGDPVSNRLLSLWRPFSLPGALGFPFPLRTARDYVFRPAVDAAAYRAKCELSVRFDARPWLSELGHPTFILVGTSDPVVPAAAGRDLARGLPRAVLHSLQGGHLVWAVRPWEVGRLLIQWSAETSAPPNSSPSVGGIRPGADRRHPAQLPSGSR
jgi:pimeloyl-ACP methyl ester carboxylesterase